LFSPGEIQGDVFEDMAALDRDIPEIDAHLATDREFGLVIIDPVTNHLGSKRPNQEEEVRPVILKYLEKQHYKSGEWSRGVVKDKDRGLGNVEVQDQYADDVTQIEQVPKSGGESR
jgi:hypothetical protein